MRINEPKANQLPPAAVSEVLSMTTNRRYSQDIFHLAIDAIWFYK
jgi:hypothetical protein